LKKNPVRLLFIIILFARYGTITATDGKTGTSQIVNLENGWQYTNGFNEEWIKNPKKFNTWLRWDPVRFPFHPSDEEHGQWITLRRQIPDSLIKMASNGIPLAVDYGLISDVNFHYINDQLFAKKGNKKPYVSALFMRGIFEFPLLKYAKPGEKNYLYVALYREQGHPNKVWGPDVKAGSAEKIYSAYFKEDILKGIFLGIYFFVALYHLLLFFRRRVDHYNLYFGLFALFFGLLGIFYMASRDFIFGHAVHLRLYTQHLLLYLSVAFLVLFTARFFTRSYTKFSIVYTGLSLLLWLVEIVSPYVVQDTTLMVFYAMVLPALVYILFVIIREILTKNPTHDSIRGKNREAAFYIFGGFVFLALAAINDILRDMEIIYSPKLADFAFLSLVIGIAGVLASRFVKIHNEVEELNVNLENKVRERTRELKQTLTEVEALKTQQDGDYFLTSLLTQPLTRVNSGSENVLVNYHIEEYKKFRFRKWEKDIGGDICIIDRIFLGEKPFTFFTNADAMGKSMQGAGGVIIYGSLIHASLDRTKNNPDNTGVLPELWIKNLFIELHKTFITFDGSMLMSCILGLLDETTGAVYFINAEHPWLILYRDHKATFVEEELKYHKLGTLDMKKRIQVDSYLLEDGDSLLLGSDGKDDLMLRQADGSTLLNEDENRFLEYVERGGADTAEIHRLIRDEANLKDDFSIMKITWQRPHSTDTRIPPEEITETVRNMENYFEKKNYAIIMQAYDDTKVFVNHPIIPRTVKESFYEICIRAASAAQEMDLMEKISGEFYQEIPLSDVALYYRVLSLKKSGKGRMAIAYAEALRMRNPSSVKNLILLADLYRRTNNIPRAEKVLKEAKGYEPDNANIWKLESALAEIHP